MNPPVCPSLQLEGIHSRVGWYLKVLASLILTLFAPSALAAPTACNILYAIQPQNTSAFGATITIQNTGTTAITSWSLAWGFANGQTISSFWNGIETQSGANVTVTNQSYNGSIVAGGSLTGMGFNGTWNGSTNAVPTAISLSGTACSVNGIAPGGGGSFSLKPSAATLSVVQGATGTDTIALTDVSPFSSSVTLAVSGLPTGVTATFGTNPATSTSVVTFTASSTATVGTSTVTITGTSGSLGATTSIALTVVAKPGFTLTPSASTLPVTQAKTATDTVTVTDVGGFTGSVTLSATGLPSGVTVTYGTNPTTSTSVLTFTATATAPVGTSTVTITGTSGTTTANTTISLAVGSSTGSFTITPSAAAVAISLGCGNGTDTITVTDVSPFAGSVTLVATGLPSGVTVTYGTNPTTTTSVLTFTASSTAVPGTSAVNITGTSGTLTAITTISLTVTAAAQSFTLIASPAALSIVQGSSGTDTITVAKSACFTGSTTLSVSGLPIGVTAAFATNPTTSTSVLTLSASSSATAGKYTITITGTSGTTTASTTIALTVTSTTSPGSFTLSSALSQITVVAGSTATDTILVTPVSGFTGSVTLAVSGLPSGVTGSWSVNPASTSSTLTLTASSTATLGTYNASINGTYGTLSQTVGFQLVIGNATASSFTLSVGSTTLNVQQNSGIADIVTVHDLNGFSGSVGFNISGLPSGVTPNFNPSTTSTNTLLALAVGTSVTPGSYPVTIEGTTTSGSFSAGVNLTLNVSAGSPLNIAWVSPISAIAGSTITILPGGDGNSFGATQGTSAIYFGTTAATVTSWAVNSIQVTVPNLAAGTVNVTADVNGVTSNAVPFVIAATTPSPTIYNGNATHFGGTGTSAGGCGVPGNIQDTQNYVALNVQNDPGNYTLNLTRPIVAPYLGDIGVWNNGLNCGRYLHVEIGQACEGTNDGTADETFCRSGAGWINDQFDGAELDMVVQDSCQDGNSWCRDDPYHLDLNQNVIDDFVLNGAAVGNLFENWSNRQLIWYFEEAPSYTGDINIYVNQGSGPYSTQVILTHLLNGLHGVNYYSDGAWQTGKMVSDNGSVYTILPTTTAGNQYQIQVYDVSGQLINSGRIYSFTLPSSCGTDCSSVTPVTYTISSAN
ncbi:MAG: cellulose binding domain-containing protein [Terracidiphilus sp.]